MEGRTLAREVTMSVSVSWRVLPACRLGRVERIRARRVPSIVGGRKEGVVLLGLLGEFLLASEVHVEADLKEDERAILAVEGVGV